MLDRDRPFRGKGPHVFEGDVVDVHTECLTKRGLAATDRDDAVEKLATPKDLRESFEQL